jgi:predicted metal-binding membrane protein
VARASAALLRDRHDRAFDGAFVLLFAVSAAATIGWCGSMPEGMAMPGGWSMSMAWMRMAGQTWPGAAAAFLGMWVVMMVAMMVPALHAMLAAYRRALHGPNQARRDALTAIAGAGYFFVWAVVGAAIYPLGVGLAAAEMRWPPVARSVPLATALVCLLAGLVQVTRWKARQLNFCRDLPGSGEATSTSAWRHGLNLGVRCSPCCSGLMAILLVGGVMDLRVMALVTAAITAERVLPRPERIARASGAIIVSAAMLAIAHAVRTA